jgi:hypothetical protein
VLLILLYAEEFEDPDQTPKLKDPVDLDPALYPGLCTNSFVQEEEFEDSKGNVVNKKTFEDLKRQGLL